eukprot:m.283617 g.283617  ORF g.283617 m.283617 type:complete len:560 (-) comp27006_c0_seq1:132-1811(-)
MPAQRPQRGISVYAAVVAPLLLLQHGAGSSQPASPQAFTSGGVFDVVVFGATPGGIVAAVAASRQLGATGSVALVEPSRWIGGMAAGGLGCTDKVGTSAVGGIALEFVNRTQAVYPKNRRLPHCTRSFEPHVATEVFTTLLHEANVTVLLSMNLFGVGTAASRITHITVGQSTSITAKVFIDATYEGDLLAAAGVGYTIGREGTSQYGESGAGRRPLVNTSCGYGFKAAIDPFGPDGKVLPLIYGGPVAAVGAADAKVMAYNYRLCLTNATNPGLRVALVQPPDYDPAMWEAPRRYMKAHPPAVLSPEVLKIYMIASSGDGIKTDVNGATFPFSTDLIGGSWAYPNGTDSERQRVIDAHVAYTKGLLWFLQTDTSVPPQLRAQMKSWGWCGDEFKDNDHFPFQLYVREARRMLGAAVATETQMRAVHLADQNASVGVADYATDCHGVEMALRSSTSTGSAVPAVEGCIDATNVTSRAWEIPYSAITPTRADAQNLLVPVAVSASHVAFASIRLELTWMVLGQSAGVAAAMAASMGIAVQDVPLPALHAALLRGGQVLSA